MKNEATTEKPMRVLHDFEPITVRIQVAVRMTGIGRSKLYELIKAGDVEIVKIGTSTLVKVESLRRLLGNRSAAPS